VRALTVAGTAIATFLVVELPALRHLTRFGHGMTFEFDHSLKGHDVPLPLNLTWGVFHLSESLWPSLGPPLLVLGLIGLAAPLIAPRERRMPLVLIASFSVFWYAVHEASPLKPYPDFARYMLALAPLLAILATSFIYELLARRDRLGIVAAVTVVVAAIPALWISVRTNGAVEDPRAVMPPILAATGARVATDRYADYDTSRKLLGDRLRPTGQTIDVVVTSNMTYDRYDSYAARNAPVLRRPAGYYHGLSALPHLDVSNGRPSLGYFNPVLRIVAMDGRVDRLNDIADAIRAAAPAFTIRMVQQGPSAIAPHDCETIERAPMRVEDEIREKLRRAFAPTELEVVNDSHHHAGHASSPGTADSHFSVVVVSAVFAGKSRLERHRMVNAALAEELKSPVHALAITALTPEDRSRAS
jgi:BolA family transcriptional regulator, general stress-responsive regulator